MNLKDLLSAEKKEFAATLRKWWSFSDTQQHAHSWHSREDYIATDPLTDHDTRIITEIIRLCERKGCAVMLAQLREALSKEI